MNYLPAHNKHHQLWKFIIMPTPGKEMDTLFLGASHVVPCCVLWFFSRISTGTLDKKSKRKKYIHSLIADLKTDTTSIKAIIEFNVTKFQGLDTLAALLDQESLNEEDEKQLCVLNMRHASSVCYMIFNERTMRQLLNSGNLRLIKTQSVSDSIMDYYGPYKETLIFQEKALEETNRLVFSLSQDILDKSAYVTKMRADTTFYTDQKPGKMNLMTRERKVLKKYAQTVATVKEKLKFNLNTFE